MLICDIIMADKFGKKALDHFLEKYDVSWREMSILIVLSNMPDASQSQFAQMLQTDKGNITKLLHRMEEKGLLSRTADEADARVKKNFLTDRGASMVPELERVMHHWESKCFQGLSKEEIENYLKVQQAFIDNTKALSNQPLGE